MTRIFPLRVGGVTTLRRVGVPTLLPHPDGGTDTYHNKPK